jgi:hypothetical protein
LVDPDPEVASQGLLAAIKLARTNGDTVRRWVTEITGLFYCLMIYFFIFLVIVDCVRRHQSSGITQYHALAALRALRQNDSIALTKNILNSIKIVTGDLGRVCLFVLLSSLLIHSFIYFFLFIHSFFFFIHSFIHFFFLFIDLFSYMFIHSHPLFSPSASKFSLNPSAREPPQECTTCFDAVDSSTSEPVGGED